MHVLSTAIINIRIRRKLHWYYTSSPMVNSRRRNEKRRDLNPSDMRLSFTDFLLFLAKPISFSRRLFEIDFLLDFIGQGLESGLLSA